MARRRDRLANELVVALPPTGAAPLYLVEYILLVGHSRHYAPSAMSAVRLVKDVVAAGGTLNAITRTRDGLALTAGELRALSDQEIGPAEKDPEGTSTSSRLLQYARRSSG